MIRIESNCDLCWTVWNLRIPSKFAAFRWLSCLKSTDSQSIHKRSFFFVQIDRLPHLLTKSVNVPAKIMMIYSNESASCKYGLILMASGGHRLSVTDNRRCLFSVLTLVKAAAFHQRILKLNWSKAYAKNCLIWMLTIGSLNLRLSKFTELNCRFDNGRSPRNLLLSAFQWFVGRPVRVWPTCGWSPPGGPSFGS